MSQETEPSAQLAAKLVLTKMLIWVAERPMVAGTLIGGALQLLIQLPALRRVGFIPVKRGSRDAADALTPAAEALAAGELVAIFPEGRVTRDPDHWPERARTGAVRLALRTGAPIVPVALTGAHRVAGRRHLVRSLLVNVVLRPRVH